MGWGSIRKGTITVKMGNEKILENFERYFDNLTNREKQIKKSDRIG